MELKNRSNQLIWLALILFLCKCQNAYKKSEIYLSNNSSVSFEYPLINFEYQQLVGTDYYSGVKLDTLSQYKLLAEFIIKANKSDSIYGQIKTLYNNQLSKFDTVILQYKIIKNNSKNNEKLNYKLIYKIGDVYSYKNSKFIPQIIQQ